MAYRIFGKLKKQSQGCIFSTNSPGWAIEQDHQGSCSYCSHQEASCHRGSRQPSFWLPKHAGLRGHSSCRRTSAHRRCQVLSPKHRARKALGGSNRKLGTCSQLLMLGNGAMSLSAYACFLPLCPLDSECKPYMNIWYLVKLQHILSSNSRAENMSWALRSSASVG